MQSRAEASLSKHAALKWFEANSRGDVAEFVRLAKSDDAIPVVGLFENPMAPQFMSWVTEVNGALGGVRNAIKALRDVCKRHPTIKGQSNVWGRRKVPARTLKNGAYKVLWALSSRTETPRTSTLATHCAWIDEANDERAAEAVRILAGGEMVTAISMKLKALSALLDAADDVAVSWPKTPRRQRGTTLSADKRAREAKIVKAGLKSAGLEITDSNMALLAIAYGVDKPCDNSADFIERAKQWGSLIRRRRKSPSLRT